MLPRVMGGPFGCGGFGAMPEASRTRGLTPSHDLLRSTESALDMHSFGVDRSCNSSGLRIHSYGQCFDSIELRGNGF